MLIPKFTLPPGWYRSRDELPYGVLVLVTGKFHGRASIVFVLRPITIQGRQRLIAYRENFSPVKLQTECHTALQFPPAEWRGLPTADAVTRAEERAHRAGEHI